MSKYEVFSGPYFPVFSSNTGKYVTEITPYFDTFNAVNSYKLSLWEFHLILQINITVKEIAELKKNWFCKYDRKLNLINLFQVSAAFL